MMRLRTAVNCGSTRGLTQLWPKTRTVRSDLAVAQDDDGTFRIRAGSVLIEYSFFNVMPERFLGVHYCHLVAPDYVEGLFTGSISLAN